MKLLDFRFQVLDWKDLRRTTYKLLITVLGHWSSVICIISLLCLPCSMLFAQTSDALFQKGNELYRQGKFAESAKLYQKIINNGEESAELYFNIGNVYFKTTDYPRAILYYERAKTFAPNDDAINFNLQLANVHVIDNVEPMPSPLYWEMWNSTKSYFSLNQLSLFVIFNFIFLLVAVAIFLYTRSFVFKKIFLLLSIVSLVTTLSFTSVLVGKVLQENSQQFGIILSEVVNVKTTPDENSGDAFVIHSGLKVQLLDTVGEWREIKLADGKVGWMKENEFEEI